MNSGKIHTVYTPAYTPAWLGEEVFSPLSFVFWSDSFIGLLAAVFFLLSSNSE